MKANSSQVEILWIIFSIKLDKTKQFGFRKRYAFRNKIRVQMSWLFIKKIATCLPAGEEHFQFKCDLTPRRRKEKESISFRKYVFFKTSTNCFCLLVLLLHKYIAGINILLHKTHLEQNSYCRILLLKKCFHSICR